MKSIYYVPVYSWGCRPDTTHDSSYATHFYMTEHDLYMFEPNAVGHFELSGELPTENEFKEQYKVKSGAV